MSVLRPLRRRVETVITNEQRTSLNNGRSIFALIDEYEDDDVRLQPAPMETQQLQNTQAHQVVEVQDSSEGEGYGDPPPRPFTCKVCARQHKRAKTEGEGSSQPAKETQLKCGICFAATTDGGKNHPHALSCGHIFGKNCIDTWINAQMPSTCPICKQVLEDSLLIHLFVSSSRDDMLEEALEKADEITTLKAQNRAEKEKHHAEKTTLIGLNTMLYNCMKNYVDALSMGCGLLPKP
ncbi:uncharacterized protein LOC130988278 [Salvia miltiorrhiza]|uniref:uncharacterized protein LOC130988278 n=1 Tax=Salvia miltiorrhiza TaxID=226208 RepID=UPI0025AC4F7F|nr:uncharacterized protein LOC130988278 [Salvia miltiorrhiza]